jgi:hypothetical protein
VLLNDPTYVEAARALAQRAMGEGGRSANARIELVFRLATGRRPTGEETAVLRALLDRQRASYRRNRPAALELLSVGEAPRDSTLNAAELAAWTTVASAVLNLDETITKQ